MQFGCMWLQFSRKMHLVLVLLGAAAALAYRHHQPAAQDHRHLHQRFHAKSTNETEKFVVVDSSTGIQYNPYSKHHPGRHVCTEKKNISVPVKTKQSYCKPVYRTYYQKCKGNQLCTGVKLEYETAYREVVTTRSTRQVMYVCCPGWTQLNNRSNACNKPSCSSKCQNGGVCVKPDYCNCPKGFYGKTCEHDVNECKEQKPCDQICHNTPGSYQCECRENFILQSDGQTCKKESDDGPGLEAKELEYEILDKRISKLEAVLQEENTITKTNNELQKINNKMEIMSKEVNDLKIKLKDLDKYRRVLYAFKDKTNNGEKNTDKMNDMWLRQERIKKCAFPFGNKMC